MKQEIIFKSKKENHVYAERDENGNMVLVDEPVTGKKYFEYAMIAGGSFNKYKDFA